MESLEEKLIDEWINHNPGYDRGFGYGSGSGYNSFLGCHSGGYGHGNCSGQGSGYGSGTGYGYVHGGIYGYDYSSGYGCGYGAGSGYGDDYGDDDSHGQRNGYEYIENISGCKLYLIDQIGTIIEHIKGRFASGFVLNGNLTLTPCYIAKGGGMFAHGRTIHEAYSALEDKLMETMPLEQRIEKFKAEFPDYNEKVDAHRLFEWHHVLTGSCLMGREQFCNNRGIDYVHGRYSVNEFLTICKDKYGWEKIECLQKSHNYIIT